MRLLAIDTTTEACSAALLTGEGLLWRAEEPGRGHAERILAMVDELLAEADLVLGALDGIAGCIGPGAFTGVRIGVSVVQGLCLGAGLPAVAVTSLEALAVRHLEEAAGPVLVCLDARMGELYWGTYAADAEQGVRALSAAAVGPAAGVQLPDAGLAGIRWSGCGRGLAAYPELVTRLQLACGPAASAALPDARGVAALGLRRLRAGAGVDPALLAPLYLRDQVALTEAERGVR
jgi:tRNA threonylcarbamoyladenosine biosynthesis protein TsaB